MILRALPPAVFCLLAIAVGAAAQAAERSPRPPVLAGTGQEAVPRLLGTLVHVQPERSLAVLGSNGQAAQTVRIGQLLDNGLRLEAIASDHVVVTRAGQRYSLPLLGQAESQRRHAPAALPAAKTLDTSTDASAPSAATASALRAGNLDDVRAACADPSLMQALPAAQKAELDALGMCTPH
ncbi:type II secretion system protein N [Stenotrophomonas sp.]|uniref:type II secretion system protein N n=1 Tax=Stenotrophomonas sp. TaxID=69392 RepID=UPI0028A8F73D|nr:type II secretion system protein N [Stenotrophomonas sp.]